MLALASSIFCADNHVSMVALASSIFCAAIHASMLALTSSNCFFADITFVFGSASVGIVFAMLSVFRKFALSLDSLEHNDIFFLCIILFVAPFAPLHNYGFAVA